MYKMVTAGEIKGFGFPAAAVNSDRIRDADMLKIPDKCFVRIDIVPIAINADTIHTLDIHGFVPNAIAARIAFIEAHDLIAPPGCQLDLAAQQPFRSEKEDAVRRYFFRPHKTIDLLPTNHIEGGIHFDVACRDIALFGQLVQV